jgi:hypothetical protein
MTAAPAVSAKEEFLAEFVINTDNSADILVNGEKKAEISPEGNVKVYDDTGIQIRPIAASAAADQEAGKISISDDGKALTVNRATVERTAEGTFLIATPGTSQLLPATTHQTAAQLAAVAKEKAAEEKGGFPIGKAAPDGWLYAGQVKGRHLFAAPEDFYGTEAEAKKEIKRLETQGIFARIPDKGELTALYNLRAAIGGFRQDMETHKTAGGYEVQEGSHRACYSSSRNFCFVFTDQTTGRNFGDGRVVNNLKNEKSAYRLVRS